VTEAEVIGDGDRALVSGSANIEVMEPWEKLAIDVAISVDPKASSKCLIPLAVAVVAVKICRGVCVDTLVADDGSDLLL
jgi:hypothetical protein